MARAEATLGAAILLVALGLAPALGYATTFVLLGLAAMATALLVLEQSRGPPGPTTEAASARRQGGRLTASVLYALAFALLVPATLATVQNPTDLLPLLGFGALLLHAPLARLIGDAEVSRHAVIGAFVGLAVALLYRYGLDMRRAAEGFWLTDPYRLAVTTLLSALFCLAWLRDPGKRWLALGAVAAALATIWLTGSRSALLGAGLLIGLSLLVLFRGRLAWGLSALAALVLGAALLFVELPGTARQPLWEVLIGSGAGRVIADPAIDIRLGLYRAGVTLFWQSPLVGHGWGEDTMRLVRELLSPEQLSWGQVVHLHNDALQFAVANGLAGFAAWLLILMAPVMAYLQLPTAARTRERTQAATVLVGGAFILGLYDTFLAAPLTLTLYVTLSAAALTPARPPLRAPLRPADAAGSDAPAPAP